MKRFWVLPAILLVIVFTIAADAYARAGCCSRHGGVCGCKCCDGTPLSAKCAPYYPDCEGGGKTVSESQSPAQEVPSTFAGEVVSITDGDTISAMFSGRAVKIRLYGIDCPERGQPFGTKAKLLTAELAFRKTVNIVKRDVDRYGRIVADVTLPDGRSVNQELVKAGLAWWYQKYAPGDLALRDLEQQARAAKVGLWADSNPVPPWNYRGKR